MTARQRAHFNYRERHRLEINRRAKEKYWANPEEERRRDRRNHHKRVLGRKMGLWAQLFNPGLL